MLTSICPYKYEDLSSNHQKPRKAGGAVVRIGNLRDLMVLWRQRQNFPKAPGPAGLPYEASDKNKTKTTNKKSQGGGVGCRELWQGQLFQVRRGWRVDLENQRQARNEGILGALLVMTLQIPVQKGLVFQVAVREMQL